MSQTAGTWTVCAYLEGPFADHRGFEPIQARVDCHREYRRIANEFAQTILGETLAPKEDSHRLQVKPGTELGRVYVIATFDDAAVFSEFLCRKQPLLPSYRHDSLFLGDGYHLPRQTPQSPTELKL
jgi:hypothetical protein